MSGEEFGSPSLLPDPVISVSPMVVCLSFPCLIPEDAQSLPLGGKRIFIYLSVNTPNMSYPYLGEW